jgi:hypothetical protein
MVRDYYRVLLERVLGPLLTEVEQENILAGLSMGELRKRSVQADIATGHCLFGDRPCQVI